jgi:hypothetical protein
LTVNQTIATASSKPDRRSSLLGAGGTSIAPIRHYLPRTVPYGEDRPPDRRGEQLRGTRCAVADNDSPSVDHPAKIVT